MSEEKKIHFLMMQGDLFDGECSMLRGKFKATEFKKAMDDLTTEMLELHQRGVKCVLYFDDNALCEM